MKKKNILITIIVLVIILVIGVIIWLNYKDKKEIQAKSREILVTTIRNDIVKYCAVEEMKILGGTFEGDPICKNSDTIIDNISQITNIDPFEKILDLDFNGVVKSIELK